jgi:vacuolar-type H+-ATPase subunit F/Vma7/lysophospholipase L1-like esterase
MLIRIHMIKVGLVVASLLIGLAMGELGLRLLGMQWPVFHRFDPILATSLLPGAEGRYTSEGDAYVRVSSQGLRDHERALTRPEGGLRIALLGDSYAEALQVSLEDSFASRLERRVSECERAGYNGPVEVINFGVSGHGTAQELLMFRHRARAFAPDLVLLLVTTGNDIRNNTRALQGASRRPYFLMNNDGIELDTSYRERSKWRRMSGPFGQTIEWLSLNSRIYQLYIHVGRTLRHRERKASDRAEIKHGVEIGLDSEVFREPKDDKWIEAWLVTEAIIQQLDRDVNETGARLLLVTGSSPVQVNPDVEVRGSVAKHLGVDSLMYPDRRLEGFAREHRIPFLMLVPHLRKWSEHEGRCVHGFANAAPCSGHWNEDGHRVAAEAVANWICTDVFGSTSSTRIDIAGE